MKLRINWILARANLSGGTKMVRELAEHMQARGHECTLVHLRSGAPWPSPWRLRSLARRVALEWQLIGRERHHLVGSSVPTIEVDGDRIRPQHVPDADVTIGTWWETMEWVRDWPSDKGIHAYYVQHHELHGGDPERVAATYRDPTLKIVISDWLRRVMTDEYGCSDVVTVRNGLDLTRFDAAARARNIIPTVGMMYSRKRWKRSELAFQAISLARETLPSLRTLSFGEMPLEPSAATPPDFEFVLRPPQATIPELYRRCDAWLLTSDSEGFGMPGLEAAACRCPVVATDCGGPAEYIDDGSSGRLVPVGDAPAAAAALLELLAGDEERWRRMSQASYERAHTFTWGASAEALEEALVRHLQ